MTAASNSEMKSGFADDAEKQKLVDALFENISHKDPCEVRRLLDYFKCPWWTEMRLEQQHRIGRPAKRPSNDGLAADKAMGAAAGL